MLRDQDHSLLITQYYQSLVDMCLSAGRQCIPHSSANPRNTRQPVPYWSTHVKPLKDDALFWHAIWKSCDSPATGAVAQIRRSTRARYHKALRFFKKNDRSARFSRMGEQFLQQNRVDFWSDVKRMQSNNNSAPMMVDNVTTEDEIARCFGDKYQRLYTSVPYDPDEMTLLKNAIDADALGHVDDGCLSHTVSLPDVLQAVKA